MTTIANIGQYILDINNYSTPTTTITEQLIDDAIDEINSECGTTIADLTGAAGTKSLVGTDDENAAVKLLSSLKLRSRNSRGPSLTMQGISKGVNASAPLEEKRLERMLSNLKELPIVIKNDPLPNE